MLEVANDKEIERLGSKAAAEYMQWHEKELESLAFADDPKARLTFESEDVDKRLYLSLRSNISHPMDFVGGTVLKSKRWAHFLLCAQDRVPDFNFITLLRPYAHKSYKEQQNELLVVPRLQFILVEIARYRDGCYGMKWKESERMRLSRLSLQLSPTSRFEVLDTREIASKKPKLTAKQHTADFENELARLVDENEQNTERARRGDQFKECLPAQEASNHYELKDVDLKLRLQTALRTLSSGEARFVIVDDVLSAETASKIEHRCRQHFEKLGDVRIHAQAIHRGDDVYFLPLFESQLAMEAQVVLSNIGALYASDTTDTLLVPKLGQLAMYDGVGRSPEVTPGYVCHLDNCADVDGEGENYRELTAILYLNQASPGCSGGALRCYHSDNEAGYEEVTPVAGKLVIFKSRELLHEVTPVLGWRRLALSAWILKDPKKTVSFS